MQTLSLISLENSARELLGSQKMEAFRDTGTFSCPWLRWSEKAPTSTCKGIFLMQDWGLANEGEGLCAAVELIDRALSSSDPVKDRTIDNLLKKDAWRQAIKRREWLVSNAVWGLRPTSKKCGYLGDRIHKAAFGVWRELVIAHARQCGQDFILIVAGGWAVFKSEFKDSEDGTLPLEKYLKLWSEWVASSDKADRLEPVPGRVIHCPHPATWGYIDVQKGPPSERVRW